MSVRKVLENFIEHVKQLEVAEESGAKGNFSKEFQHLKKKSGNYLRDGTYPAKEGEKEVNKTKNRYKDILPFDYTRVALHPVNGEDGSDYINANFLKGINDLPAYIAAQGPLPGTVNDFWRMIWQYDVKVIVMASNEYEAGKHKCQRYWPVEDEEKHFMDLKVTSMSEERHTEFVMRTINAEKDGESRTILQFHYVSWPDHGIPSSTRPMLDMIALVREYQPGHDPPIVVHCSAGCGRTGTICAIDYSWNLLKMGKLTAKFSLYKIIAEMRRQRPSMVQAKDQYVIAHKAVSELFERHLEVMNYHFYENVDENGQPRSPSGESPSSESGQLLPDSSYEDLASPIVRIELAPPAKLPKRRSMIVENATSPTHKAVKSTVAQIIKSESDNDLKAGTSSQLKCATPTLETRFSFDEKDIENTVPPSPTRITLTGPGHLEEDSDVLLAEGCTSSTAALRPDTLSTSCHSAESGYSSNASVGHSTLRTGTGPPNLTSEELDLCSQVSNLHISGGSPRAASESQVAYLRDKKIQGDKPRKLLMRDKTGHKSVPEVDASQAHLAVKLPGSHTRETCTDDIMSLPSPEDPTLGDEEVFLTEENPVYGARNVPTGPTDVPVNRQKSPTPPPKPQKNISLSSPTRAKNTVPGVKKSISEGNYNAQRRHQASPPKQPPPHSKIKPPSPVKNVPKPVERNVATGNRKGFVDKKSANEDYIDVEAIHPAERFANQKARSPDTEKSGHSYAYPTDDDMFKPFVQDTGVYSYADPDAAHTPLQATAQRLLQAEAQRKDAASAGAKPKVANTAQSKNHGKNAPSKPPRKPKPDITTTTNVFNAKSTSPTADASISDWVYEPVNVPRSASNGSTEDDAYCPVEYRHKAVSSGSSVDEMYSHVESKSARLVRSTSHESWDSGEEEEDDGDDAPAVPPKTPLTYQSSSEESLPNQMAEIPDDLLKSTAGAVRTIGRVFKKKVQQAFGANTWPLPNERDMSSPGAVMFKDREISYRHRVARPAGPRTSSKFTLMPARSK